MQARAIFEAAGGRQGKRPASPLVPEVMVPLIATRMEFDPQSRRGSTRPPRRSPGETRHQDRLSGRHHDRIARAPRSWPGEIAETAEFLLLRHNDLTQTTFGISRDDAASFLAPTPPRASSPSTRSSPSTATASANWCGSRPSARPQGAAEPQARYLRRARRRPGFGRVLHEIGLDYVSCSPFRVPIARLAAAQAALGNELPRVRRSAPAARRYACVTAD